MPPAASYLQTQVMTASPFELHLMVVDGAVRYAKFARQALERNDFEMSHVSLSKCRDFVAELISGLKGDQQPELVDRLKAMFQYAWKNLIRADLEHDPQRVTQALRVLEAHRDTWKELGAKLKQEADLQMAQNGAPEEAMQVPKPHFLDSPAGAPRFSRVV